MAIDHRFMIKKLQTLPEMFVAFSQVTKLPFVTCDEETFNDQIHIFTTQEQLQEFAKSYAEKKIFLIAIKVANEQFLHFYGSLYNIGINTLVLHEPNAATEFALEQVVHRRQEQEELPPEKRPLMNPELLLTSLYFLQEMRRPIPPEEKQGLAELDEELVANLVRARFLSAIEVDPNQELKNGKNNVRVPFIKNDRGEIYQAIFTDGYELRKFDPHKKLRPVVVGFDDLTRLLLADAKGYVLNPQSIALPLRREQLPAFKKRIDG